MTRVINTADISELEGRGAADREVAETLVSWTREDGVRYGVDVSPAELLSLAATYAGLSGDLEWQWQLLEQARTADGETAIDVEAKIVAGLVLRGEREAALELADELRRQGVRSILSYGLVSDAMVDLDEQTLAMRWLNMGLRGFERIFGDDPDEGALEILDDLLVSRLEIRRQLGLAPDSYDDEAMAMNDESIAMNDG